MSGKKPALITKTTIIEGLRLFNEKAVVLNRRNFSKWMDESGGISFTISMSSPPGSSTTWKSETTGPDEEAIHAFVMTFRFFIQDNERCSLHRLSDYYNSGLIEDNLKNRFNSNRNALNSFLDSPGMFNFTVELGEGPELLTRRRVMEIFTYGGIAHATPEKKKIFDFLRQILAAQTILQADFTLTLVNMRQGINFIKGLNDEALKQLSQV